MSMLFFSNSLSLCGLSSKLGIGLNVEFKALNPTDILSLLGTRLFIIV